jgi:hypothetical protein
MNLFKRRFYCGILNLTVSSLCILLMTSCGKFGMKSNTSGDSEAQGVVLAQSMLFDPSRPLVVCWSTHHPSQSELRRAVENHVVSNFARTRKLRIQKGWGDCKTLNGKFDVGVYFFDDPDFQSSQSSAAQLKKVKERRPQGPGNPFAVLGRKFLQGNPFGVQLNSSDLGRPDASARINKLTKQGRHNYTMSASLHEFGHAAGLKHEHAHPKNDCFFEDEPLGEGIYKGIPVTGYDRVSIMNYCRFAKNPSEFSDEVNTKIFHFSDGDVATLNKVY